MKRGEWAGPKVAQHGTTYVAVLLLVAALGMGLAKAATALVVSQQRERESSLLRIGGQIRAAIGHYYDSGPGGQYPSTLDDLIEDNRTGTTTRHLRRLFADPMPGAHDWGLVPGPQGTIMGVFSQAPGRPIKQRNFPPGNEGFEDRKSYSEWVFVDRRRDVGASAGERAISPPLRR